MTYQIKLTTDELAGVYVLDKMIKQPKATISHTERQSAAAVVAKLMACTYISYSSTWSKVG